MAFVRMHSPPARHVKRPNQRWNRQRPSTRGAGPVDDHGGGDIYVPPAPTITSVSPTSTTVGGPRAFTATGTGFTVAGAPLVFFTAGADPESSSAGNVVDDTHFSFTLPTGAVDTAGTITWRGVWETPVAADIPGPSITVA